MSLDRVRALFEAWAKSAGAGASEIVCEDDLVCLRVIEGDHEITLAVLLEDRIRMAVDVASMQGGVLRDTTPNEVARVGGRLVQLSNLMDQARTMAQ